MQNNLKPFFVLLGMFFSATVLAESTTIDDLTKIEAETLVLKAREKQLNVQAQIASKQAEIASKQADADRLMHTGTASVDDPIIRSIEGIGKALYATLELDNGHTVDVKIGDILPNGMRIASIRSNEVVVELKDKRRIRLNTGSQAVTQYNATSTSKNKSTTALLPPIPTFPARGIAP